MGGIGSGPLPKRSKSTRKSKSKQIRLPRTISEAQIEASLRLLAPKGASEFEVTLFLATKRERITEAIRWIEETFRHLVKLIQDTGIDVRPVDAFKLADWAFYEWQKQICRAVMFATGLTETDEAHGNEERKAPAVTIHRQAEMQQQRIEIQFGMSPASRARLGITADVEEVTLADILFADVPHEVK